MQIKMNIISCSYGIVKKHINYRLRCQRKFNIIFLKKFYIIPIVH